MTTYKRRTAAVAALAVAAAGLAACSAAPASNGSEEDAFNIAFVTGQINDPFYVTMQAGAEERAQELGVNLDYQGATVWDPSAQIPIFDSVRATGPDFLISVPVEQTALTASVQQFTSAGIPSITVDTDLADTSARLMNISSDNTEGGKLAADTLASLVGEKGKVALLCYQPGITVNDQRREGFEKQIAEYSDIEYVGAQLMQGADPTESVRYFDAVLQAHPDVDGVVACANVATVGIMSSLKEKGLTDQVSLVGFDADQDLVGGLRDESVSALIVQQTKTLGAEAVQWAYDYLSGEDPSEDDVRLPFTAVTMDNLDDPEVAELVAD